MEAAKKLSEVGAAKTAGKAAAKAADPSTVANVFGFGAKVEDYPYRMLLIGETGAGKTSFLNLLCNCGMIKMLRREFTLELIQDFHDIKLEHASSHQMESKTSGAKLYSAVLGEMKIGIIDTPGFGDSRGLEQDERNVKSIIDILREEEYVNCVCLVVNGRLSRITVSLQYVLSEITAVLPNKIVGNVIVVFTNTADPLDLNFDLEQLRPFFGQTIVEDHTFYIENSYCILEKAKMKYGQLPTGMIAKSLKKSLEKTAEVLDEMSKGIRDFKKVYTHDFISLNEKRQKIEEGIVTMLEVDEWKKSLELGIKLLELLEEYHKLGVAQNYANILEKQVEVIKCRLYSTVGPESHDLQKTKEKLEQKLQVINTTLHAYDVSLRASKKKEQQLQSQLATVQQESQGKEQKLSKLKDENVDLHKKMLIVKYENEQLQEELKRLHHKAGEDEVRLTASKKKEQQLQSQLATVEQESQKKEQQLSKLEDENYGLHMKMLIVKYENEQQQEELKRLQQKASEDEVRVTASKEKEQQLQSQVATVQRESQDKEQKLSKLKDENHDLHKKMLIVKYENEQLKEELKRLQQEEARLTASNEEQQRLLQQYQRMGRARDVPISQLQGGNELLQDKYATPTLLKLKTMKGTDDRPLNIIETVAAGDYVTFGICLLQDENGEYVELIKKDNRDKGAESITHTIIQKWLTSGAPTRTYQHLIECLRESKLGTLAEKIAGIISNWGEPERAPH